MSVDEFRAEAALFCDTIRHGNGRFTKAKRQKARVSRAITIRLVLGEFHVRDTRHVQKDMHSYQNLC